MAPCSSDPFGLLKVSKRRKAAVAVMHKDMLPFSRALGLPGPPILTDDGREFISREDHPYYLDLHLNGIEHRRTKGSRPNQRLF